MEMLILTFEISFFQNHSTVLCRFASPPSCNGDQRKLASASRGLTATGITCAYSSFVCRRPLHLCTEHRIYFATMSAVPFFVPCEKRYFNIFTLSKP